MKLTIFGKEAIDLYIRNLQAKRKEILDAGKDTADETTIPTEEDILADLEYFENDGEYFNSWGVTDNYDADYPLCLVKGLDYIY